MTEPCNSFIPEPPFSINVLRRGINYSDSASSSQPPSLRSLLPGVFRDESLPQLVVPALTANYLTAEFGLGRLDVYGHHWFWLLGVPALPRPLHDCSHRGRTICVTERMDRHLGLGIGNGRRDLLYLKPLPRLLLDSRFWTDILSCDCGSDDELEKSRRGNRMLPNSAGPTFRRQGSSTGHRSQTTTASSTATRHCAKRHLWECALGFLYSYAALVPYESDFHIAHAHGLLPPEVAWDQWRVLTRQIVSSPDVRAHRFHQRFLYGELRLHRLRELGQLRRGGLIPVLISRLDLFTLFFQNNVRWLASLVAYLAIVLSALQTGLTSERLAASNAFQVFSAGFTIFSLIGPLAIMLGFALYFGLSLLYHIAAHIVTTHLSINEENDALGRADSFRHWDQKSDV